MAIKLSGSVSRKVPIPGLDYSSQSYSAGMEIEIGSADGDEVQAQLSQLYASLNQGIDAQIAVVEQQSDHGQRTPVINNTTRSQPAPVQTAPLVQQRPAYINGGGRNRVAAVTNGNGNGRRVNATEAQCRAIYAICKSQGIDMASVLADFNVAEAKDLHVKDASRLIDQLKSQNGNGAAAH